MSTGRRWLTKMDPSKCGPEFYTFYNIRAGIEGLSDKLRIKCKRMEELALEGQFEQVLKEYRKMIEKEIPDAIAQIEKGIKMETQGANK